jgi:ribulose-5-phosphate 4-epimerase/fuculose-1-phosphate aldolase
MLRAMTDHPRTFAVLVRRHGVYVWGSDWIQAKTHAECYHYLFEAVVRMREIGISERAAESRLSSIEGGKR